MPEGLSDLSPTLRRWELGGTLRRIREDQGKTIEQVAHALSDRYGRGFSAAKIGRLETGKRGANPRDVRDLCDYYGVPPEERDRLVDMARDVRQDNRLQSVDDAYAEYVALESVAKTLHVYEPMFVPGLLQTEGYYRANFDSTLGIDPRARYTADSFRMLSDIRRERQLRMGGDNAIDIHAIIDENVIRRRVGSAQVMSEQLAHLIEVSHSPNVELRVIPLTQGVYPGCESSGFSLLGNDPTEHVRDNACYVEGFTQALWAEALAERQRISEIFAHMEAIALAPDESRALIDEAMANRSL